ncbi:MAG: sortase [Chloroflexi bacterium]|nr:sortase [Chloroflexota bacterium]
MQPDNHDLHTAGLCIWIALWSLFRPAHVPVTGKPDHTGIDVFIRDRLPRLDEFINTVRNGDPDTLVGAYVPGLMALPILQQPATDPTFVSEQPGAATQFRSAGQVDSTGLLAHNFLAGEFFSRLGQSQTIILVYGDGRLEYFQVTQIQRYQALEPYNPYSYFVNPADPGRTLSSTDVFNQTYGQGNVLVFQTCIQKEEQSSWGRLFVIARPVSRQGATPHTSQLNPFEHTLAWNRAP